jgi:hypothetical protein
MVKKDFVAPPFSRRWEPGCMTILAPPDVEFVSLASSVSHHLRLGSGDDPARRRQERFRRVRHVDRDRPRRAPCRHQIAAATVRSLKPACRRRNSLPRTASSGGGSFCHENVESGFPSSSLTYGAAVSR